MVAFGEAVVITGIVSELTSIESYLLESLIQEETKASVRARGHSISGDIKLERHFEDEATSAEFMSHRIRNIVSYGMAEMMR